MPALFKNNPKRVPVFVAGALIKGQTKSRIRPPVNPFQRLKSVSKLIGFSQRLFPKNVNPYTEGSTISKGLSHGFSIGGNRKARNQIWGAGFGFSKPFFVYNKVSLV
jgi:hypothetical protein